MAKKERVSTTNVEELMKEKIGEPIETPIEPIEVPIGGEAELNTMNTDEPIIEPEAHVINEEVETHNEVEEVATVESTAIGDLPENHPDRYKPLFEPEAYDLSRTKEDDQQTKVIASQMLHYMKDDLIKLNNSQNVGGVSLMYDKPWYGVYSVDHYTMRGQHIGVILPEIAYLPNKNIPLRQEMLNLEWIERLVKAGCIVKDLTPGVWDGYINSKNIASYLKKVHWMLDNGKLRP